jgi:hypothetical protein
MSDTHTAPDLTKPTFEALSYILRHKELWPKGFKWDYSLPPTCAIGITNEIWGSDGCHHGANWFTHNSNLSAGAVKHIFFEATAPANTLWERFMVLLKFSDIEVQAHHVADLIDAYLEKSGGG